MSAYVTGVAHGPKGPVPMWPVLCLLADRSEEYAGVFSTREQAVAQCDAWRLMYPEARIVLYEPEHAG